MNSIMQVFSQLEVHCEQHYASLLSAGGTLRIALCKSSLSWRYIVSTLEKRERVGLGMCSMSQRFM